MYDMIYDILDRFSVVCKCFNDDFSIIIIILLMNLPVVSVNIILKWYFNH